MNGDNTDVPGLNEKVCLDLNNSDDYGKMEFDNLNKKENNNLIILDANSKMETDGPDQSRYILEYTREELAIVLKELGLPAWRLGQIRRWIFARKTADFTQMTDLSKDLRNKLTDRFGGLESEGNARNSIWSSKLVTSTGSPDGTMKILLEFPDGHRVESVLLGFEQRHKTACISTQVGCAMRCAFCASGMDGFVRNLTRGEILEQLLRLNALLGPNDRLTHVVVMGTGEPTLNLDNLLSALVDATAQDGLDIGNRRITVSSVGIPDGIRKMADADVPYKLAVSLHAPNDEIRNQIIPRNRTTGIKKVLDAADYYFKATGRRVTFEYILIDELNSKPEHARELARLLAGKTAIVNLIPYNPIKELKFKTPPAHAVQRFSEILESMGIQVKTRFRMGDKIDAACGQLRRSFRGQ